MRLRLFPLLCLYLLCLCLPIAIPSDALTEIMTETINETMTHPVSDAAPFSDYQWQNRLLVVFAPARDAPAFQQQLKEVERAREGFEERDMILIPVPDTADNASVYARYNVEPGGFTAVLIGKDGTEKQRWAHPTAMEPVFGLIDTMPMRQREIKRREMLERQDKK